MNTQQISKEFLVKLFGEDVVGRHIDFIQFCAGIKKKLPPHVTLDNVVKQVAANRNYHLISNLVFVHEKRLDALRQYLNKNSAASNEEIRKALESIPST